MSVLVVGVSHKTAPVALLERLALDQPESVKLLDEVTGLEHVSEAVVIATCNRLEVYTEVDRFHGSVEEVSRLIVERAGVSTDAMIPHLYVHYDDGAVSHLFHVASGLDSMAIGEGQILGQTRAALRTGQEQGSVGPALNVLFQQALRVGKRAHAETGLDRAAPSLVASGLDALERGVAGRRVVVLGAGSMAALAVATVTRLGAGEVTVVNRSEGRAAKLADEYGVRVRDWSSLSAGLADADLLITCTGAAEVLLDADRIRRLLDDPSRRAAGLDILDLALPHDVDPAVADLDGVVLVNLANLADRLQADDGARVGAGDARAIVIQEVAAFVGARRQSRVTPTVVALRSMATALVDAELARLDSRLPDLDPDVRAEVVHAVRRVADKLLHQPTVRVRELAGEGGAVSYEAALAELFSLNPDSVGAVTRPGGMS